MSTLHEQLMCPNEASRLAAIKIIFKKKPISLEDQGFLKKLSRQDVSPKVRNLARLGLAALYKTSLAAGMPENFDVDDFLSSELGQKLIFIEYVTRNREKDGFAFLQDILKQEEDLLVITRLLFAISITRDRKALPTLIKHIAHPDRRVAKAAILALRFSGEVHDLPNLVRLKDPHDAFIQKAIHQLVEVFSDHDVFALFFRLVTDEDERKKAVLLKFFLLFFRNEFIPFLLELSQCDNANISKIAQDLIEKHGHEFKLEGVDSKEKDLNRRIDQYLEKHWQIPPEVIEDLRNPSGQTRLKALKRVMGKLSWELLQPDVKAITEKGDARALATMIPIFAKLSVSGMLDKLLRHQNHEDGRVRANLVESMVHFSDDRRFEELASSFVDDANNRAIANAVIISADRFPKIAEKGINRLLTEFGDLGKKSAIYALISVRTEEFLDYLEKLTADPSEEIRKRAIEGLQLLALESSRKAQNILANLVNKGPSLWEEIDGTVGILDPIEEAFTQDKVILRKLEFDLESPDENEQLAGVKALGTIGDESVLEAIQTIMGIGSPEVQYEAGRAFDQIRRRTGHLAPPEKKKLGEGVSVDWLKEQLSSSTQAARLEALKMILPKDGFLLPHLLEHLGIETDPYVKPVLISVIAMLGDKKVIPYLVPFLSDPADRVKANAVEALAQLGDKSVCPLLLCLLDDENHRIRANVLKALNSLGGTNIWTALCDMLKSKDARMRASALHVLGDFGRRKLAETKILLDGFLTRERDYYLFARAVQSSVKVFGSDSNQGLTFLQELREKLADPKKKRLLDWGLEAMIGVQIDLEDVLKEENILAIAPASRPEYQDLAVTRAEETAPSKEKVGEETETVSQRVAAEFDPEQKVVSAEIPRESMAKIVPPENSSIVARQKMQEDLRNESSDVRRTAIGNIVFSGKAGEVDLDSLEKPLEDEDQSVRNVAAYAKAKLAENLAAEARRKGAAVQKSREEQEARKAKERRLEEERLANPSFQEKFFRYAGMIPFKVKAVALGLFLFYGTIFALKQVQEDLPEPVQRALKSEFVKTVTSFKLDEGVGKTVKWSGRVRSVNRKNNAVVIERDSYVFSVKTEDKKLIEKISKGANVTVSGKIVSRSHFGAVHIDGKITLN